MCLTSTRSWVRSPAKPSFRGEKKCWREGDKRKKGENPLKKKEKKEREKNIREEERWGIESVWMKKKSYSGEGIKT